MSDAIRHVTTEGERWDLLAYAYYGDPTGYERIMAANPGVRLHPILPSGIVLVIPTIEQSEPRTTEDLPPWKRP